ncbi:uncharacterized protein PHALS_10449 [Plasmopara halstedii]|uniref:Uncharacterized protein n=1 Tax=Plasmopara halstedii TaxID=4781 RepID=A0A0P1AHM7_PLAHL|nr:uncharacterized protein PHALS_10449 [Plasmopara halstedii]CEG40237.1 hypothetical protein PHALS_10449 [Plasmopara halstedii]|eukprot:XP_024576606.1 hypothetical protein PHALS_10449 [Plasmopara halstedii]
MVLSAAASFFELDSNNMDTISLSCYIFCCIPLRRPTKRNLSSSVAFYST